MPLRRMRRAHAVVRQGGGARNQVRATHHAALLVGDVDPEGEVVQDVTVLKGKKQRSAGREALPDAHCMYGATLPAIVRNSASVSGAMRNAAHPLRGVLPVPCASDASDP